MPAQAGTDGSLALTLPVSSHPGHLHSAWLVSQMYTNDQFRQLLTDSENSHHVGHANSRDLHSSEDESCLNVVSMSFAIKTRIPIIIIPS